jgi:hypothetical protein
MNRKDYAAYLSIRDTARMDRGFRHSPAIIMPRKRKPQRNAALVPVIGAAFCAACMFIPYFI